MNDVQTIERDGVSSLPTEPRPRFRLLPALAVGFLAVLVVLGAVAVTGLRTLAGAIPTPGDVAAVFEPEPYEQIGPVVITSLRDLADLTTVETVQYALVEKGTDGGWLSWARGDSIRLFAVARIGAGVDLSRISEDSVSVTETGLVTITLPRATIQYVAPDNEATQVLDRNLGLLTKGDPQLESETRQLADGVLLDNAIESGILYDAESNARRVITNFLLSLGYRDVIVRFAG